MVIAVLLMILGFVLLFYGAKWLVTGSASLARSLGVSSLIIGVTVVAFGTSAPELIVSIFAALEDKGEIALGNIVGSNIANIGLILGAAAVIQPLKCQIGLMFKEIPIMLAVTFVLAILSLDAALNFTDGLLLFVGIVAFISYSYFAQSKEHPSDDTEVSQKILDNLSWPKKILLIAAGIAGLVAGGDTLLSGAVTVARLAGVSEKFIGLTLIAVGTSLPELATSIVAAIKREHDISIGNILGSNIFNILGILGITSMIKTITIESITFKGGFIIDYIVMLFFALLTLVLMKAGRIITRVEGAGLLLLYGGYIVYLSII